MMIDPKLEETGLLVVLFNRFRNIRLPRALAMKDSMAKGETLNDFDMEFLSEVLDDAHHLLTIAESHPELGPVVHEVLRLYDEISEEALLNEA